MRAPGGGVLWIGNPRSHSNWDERVFTGMSHGDRNTIMALMRRIAQSSCQTLYTTGDCIHADE